MGKVKIKVGKEDVEKSEASGDFEPAPVGLYVLELIEVNPGFAKGEGGKEDKSRPYLECIWRPVGLGREGKPLTTQYSQIWDYVSFGEASKWKMAQFALAIGLKTNAKGEIDGEIEIEDGKPGTIIGTKVIGRLKKDSDQEGNYRPKVGNLSHIDGAASESGDDAFADDDAGGSPFDDTPDDTAGEDDLLTREGLEEIEDLKELGSLAGEFDLTPQDFIIKTRGKVDPAKTKAALIDAILEAQDGPADDADGGTEDLPDDPF